MIEILVAQWEDQELCPIQEMPALQGHAILQTALCSSSSPSFHNTAETQDTTMLNNILNRPRGKESTKVRISQNNGKGKRKLLPGIEEITEGLAHGNCIEIFKKVWTP